MVAPLFPVLMLFVAAQGSSGARMPSVDTLIEEARRAHRADHESWKAYAFTRHVTRRSVDEDGEVTFREDLHFRVTPAGDGNDEELYEIDGRPPAAKEVKEHRAAKRFTKHRDQAATFELKNPIGEDLAMAPMILDQEHRLVGQEEIDGIHCYRVEFEARPEPEGVSTKEKLKYALKGSACLAVDGAHILEMELESTRPVKDWPAVLNHVKLRFERRPAGGVWLPQSIEIRSDVKIPGKTLRKWNEYRYTDYRRVKD